LATRHASNRDAYVAAKAMYVQQVLEHIKTRRAPAMTASNR
jgi:hypothetical protein